MRIRIKVTRVTSSFLSINFLKKVLPPRCSPSFFVPFRRTDKNGKRRKKTEKDGKRRKRTEKDGKRRKKTEKKTEISDLKIIIWKNDKDIFFGGGFQLLFICVFKLFSDYLE